MLYRVIVDGLPESLVVRQAGTISFTSSTVILKSLLSFSCLSVCLSVFLGLCPLSVLVPVSFSVGFFLTLSLSLHVCLCLSASFYLCLSLSLSVPVCVSLSISVRPCLSLYLNLFLSPFYIALSNPLAPFMSTIHPPTRSPPRGFLSPQL